MNSVIILSRRRFIQAIIAIYSRSSEIVETEIIFEPENDVCVVTLNMTGACGTDTCVILSLCSFDL